MMEMASKIGRKKRGNGLQRTVNAKTFTQKSNLVIKILYKCINEDLINDRNLQMHSCTFISIIN